MRRWCDERPPRKSPHEFQALFGFSCAARGVPSLRSVLSMALPRTLFSIDLITSLSVSTSSFRRKVPPSKHQLLVPSHAPTPCHAKVSIPNIVYQAIHPTFRTNRPPSPTAPYSFPLKRSPIDSPTQNHRPPPQQHPSTPLPSTQPSTPPTPPPSQDFHCHHFHPSTSFPPLSSP